MDSLFFVNAGLIVFFFWMFGSRFVLAPGLGVEFQMPAMPGSLAGARATDCVISVRPSGEIFADGLVDMAQLRGWLSTQAKGLKEPSLLVRASLGVQVKELTEIVSAAKAAGFARVVLGAEEASADVGTERTR
jgi:biopolymer transport protein ExbD